MVNFFNFLEMGNLYTFCLSSRLWDHALTKKAHRQSVWYARNKN